MSEEEGEKWGLVPTHAYAVLDIREYKVSSKTEDVFRYLFENCLQWIAADFFALMAAVVCHWEITESLMMLYFLEWLVHILC